jgi:hypothetical protein
MSYPRINLYFSEIFIVHDRVIALSIFKAKFTCAFFKIDIVFSLLGSIEKLTLLSDKDIIASILPMLGRLSFNVVFQFDLFLMVELLSLDSLFSSLIFQFIFCPSQISPSHENCFFSRVAICKVISSVSC